jgi:hypothetical protein
MLMSRLSSTASVSHIGREEVSDWRAGEDQRKTLPLKILLRRSL